MTTLVVFTHLCWNTVYQRPQQLLSRLAKRFLVLFVDACARHKPRAKRDRANQALLPLLRTPYLSACASV